MIEIKKILFAGVDNAGKTSILHILKKNYSFLNKLKPTKGIERSKSNVLGIDFVLWDLGGQKKYITEYFERKEFIFSELSLLFFVIDIQDELRFDDVISYFGKILEVLKEHGQNPKIIILFHKVDPDIEHSENIRLFIKDLKKKIRKLSSGFDLSIFETSIFKRWSIISAFSYGIRSLSETNVIKISEILEALANRYQATAILLMSREDIIIGEFSSDEKSATTINQYLDELRKIYTVSEKPVILRMNGDLLTINSLQIGDFSLNIVKYTNNSEIDEESFMESVPLENKDEFEGLLVNFFQKL